MARTQDPYYEEQKRRDAEAARIAANPPLPAGIDPAMAGFANWMKAQRGGDYDEGIARFGGEFGANNPAIAEILAARKKAAFGTDTAGMEMARGIARQEINQNMQTGMRQLRGMLGSNGVRGAAVGGMAQPIMRQAAQDTVNLEQRLAADEAARRESAMNAYESSLTGERAARLGTGMAWAGLGSGDRISALDFLKTRAEMDRLNTPVPFYSKGGGKNIAPTAKKKSNKATRVLESMFAGQF